MNLHREGMSGILLFVASVARTNGFLTDDCLPTSSLHWPWMEGTSDEACEMIPGTRLPLFAFAHVPANT